MLSRVSYRRVLHFGVVAALSRGHTGSHRWHCASPSPVDHDATRPTWMFLKAANVLQRMAVFNDYDIHAGLILKQHGMDNDNNNTLIIQ